MSTAKRDDGDELLARIKLRERHARRRTLLYSLVPVCAGLIVLVYSYGAVRQAMTNLDRLEGQIRLKTEQLIATQSKIDSKQRELQLTQQKADELNETLRQLAARIDALPNRGQQIATLKDEASAAWTKFPPQQAWCYQEIDPKQPASKAYGVHCHWSKERCNLAKSGSKTASACELVQDLMKTHWSPRARGYMDSWYELELPQPLPTPFPQFLASKSR